MNSAAVSPSINAVSSTTTPWASIAVTACVALCSAVQFTLYFSSLWPYLQILDPQSTEAFLGIVVAAFSFSQICVSPLFGYYSNRIRSVVRPVYFCLLLSLLGNMLYFLSPLLPENRRYGILIGRCFVGMGESSFSLLQSFASTASLPSDRSRGIAIMTGGLALGIVAGPSLQLLFTPLGTPGIVITQKIHIDMYSAPALMCCLMNITSLLLMRFAFVERYAGVMDHNKPKAERAKLPDYDKTAVGLCYITRFTQFFVFTNMETLGSPFVMAVFGLTKADAVKYMAIAHSIMGTLAFMFYVAFTILKIDKFVNFRLQCIGGLLGLVIFHLGTFEWPFYNRPLQTYSTTDYELFLLGNRTIEPVGCPTDRFSWCDSIGSMNIWVYFLMFILGLGICFPNINISLSTLLSRIVGPRHQSQQQSIFQMSSSLARLTGPILISNLYTAFGPRSAWLLEIAVLILTISLWIVFYGRMVPLEIPPVGEETDITEKEETDGSADPNEFYRL